MTFVSSPVILLLDWEPFLWDPRGTVWLTSTGGETFSLPVFVLGQPHSLLYLTSCGPHQCKCQVLTTGPPGNSQKEGILALFPAFCPALATSLHLVRPYTLKSKLSFASFLALISVLECAWLFSSTWNTALSAVLSLFTCFSLFFPAVSFAWPLPHSGQGNINSEQGDGFAQNSIWLALQRASDFSPVEVKNNTNLVHPASY